MVMLLLPPPHPQPQHQPPPHIAPIATPTSAWRSAGAVPQPDGSQKAVEVHIFAESQRGTGDGHRDGWPGAPNGTMTNGEAGAPVTSVDGLSLMVKYKGGEKKIIVSPTTPIVQYQISDASVLKPGSAISIVAATKKPDGTFETNRINVGLNGVVP